ncbi:pseudaminic acid synthase [Helicobacter sp. CLO-3]|uniref:pseudaminic acid synthase n=1 Tax=unclassified Helicobacter TaxID=2593540 RepID=UPI000805A64E|nr:MULTISPECIES: pseudaminic acid synthase [unclassified Helicobacter]OBV28639.1 pseudaminic acid synthase [Helicobacter sp. CLO-3]OHU82524.1 pseudaminic acid synthase [Helicobacter sp. CLO-3]
MPRIAPTRQSLIIAELSANHNQSLNLAKRSIRAAHLAGADFVKLQTYTPECLTIDSHKPYFRIDSGTLWDGQTLYDLYKQAYTPFEWHAELFAYARAVGVGLFSSPFSPKALELLERLACPMYKIASFEITDTPFIELVASTQKPIVISTGIATHAQIMDALEACDKAGNSDVTLLLCTSSYPAPLELANIASMQSLARYGTKFGLSDHTQGDICAILASVLGASMIEKHFIIKRSLGGVDSAFSMEAREFAQMVQRIKDAHTALGSPEPSKDEAVRASQARFARSLFVCEDIAKGEILDAKNIRAIRPNDGLPPKLLPEILGKRATHDLQRGEPLRNGDFE